MELHIKVISASGKAFVEDLESTAMYYMDNKDEQLREAEPMDYMPMNTQGIPIDPKKYDNERFTTLDDAHKYICKTTIEEMISTLADDTTGLLESYKEELKKYD